MSSLDRFNFPSKEPLNIRSPHTLHLNSQKEELDLLQSFYLYKKPAGICQCTDRYLRAIWKDPDSLIAQWKEEIEHRILSHKLELRLMKAEDTEGIREFLTRRYNPEMAQEICAFDLFRFRNYGHGLLLIDSEAKIQGTIFEVAYSAEHRTSYTIRLAIDEHYAGKGLGQDLMQYSCLTAMENGAKVKRGIIQFQNLQSLHINLNKVGWICDRFEEDVNGLGAFFHIALPLSLQGLSGNILDLDRCKYFLKEHRAEFDYKLLDCEDFEGVKQMYAQTDFKVVASLKAGYVSEKASFLAISAKSMGLAN